LRAQVRLLGTVISGDTRFLCISNGGARCAISVRDVEGFVQGDLMAGFYLAF